MGLSVRGLKQLLTDQPHHRPGHTGGQGTRDDGPEAEGYDLITPFRGHGPQSTDHDAETTRVGKPAHGIGHDEFTAISKSTGRQVAQVEVGQ